MHTTVSDGRLPPELVARAAGRAGVKVVMFADHERTSGAAGWLNGVLMVPGQESTLPACHLLGLGLGQSLAVSREPAVAAAQVKAAGGFDALAHPLDQAMERFSGSGCYAATDHTFTGYSGLELWNAMSALKRGLNSVPAGLGKVFLPLAHLAGPDPLELALWDTVGRRRAWPAFAAADAHCFGSKRAWLPVRVYSYQKHGRLITTGLWLTEPFSGEHERDQALALAALAAGRSVLALGPLRGVEADLAGPNGESLRPGVEMPFAPGWQARLSLPSRGLARLLRNGALAREAVGRKFSWPLDRPGVWRWEARQWRVPTGWRPWLFCNPFYLREAGFVPQPS